MSKISLGPGKAIELLDNLELELMFRPTTLADIAEAMMIQKLVENYQP